MDNKTKEIVERLYTIAARLDDDAEASNYIDADMVASLHVAANLITRLSERVGELERELDFSLSCALSGDVPWTPDVHRRLEGGRALLSKQERRPVSNASACEDCGRPYAEPGFVDLIVPLAVWKQISTHGDETGLLCPSCLIARLDRAGLENVPAALVGRAVESVTHEAMLALREGENRALSKQGEGS